MALLIAFLALFLACLLLGVLGRSIIPTTVQPTRGEFPRMIPWCFLIAMVLTLLGAGAYSVWTAVF